MAAPLGNQFWKLRSKHGRDKIFADPETMWEAACDYFQWCVDTPLMEVQQAKSTQRPTKDENGNVKEVSPLLNCPGFVPSPFMGYAGGFMSIPNISPGLRKKPEKKKMISQKIFVVSSRIYVKQSMIRSLQELPPAS